MMTCHVYDTIHRLSACLSAVWAPPHPVTRGTGCYVYNRWPPSLIIPHLSENMEQTEYRERNEMTSHKESVWVCLVYNNVESDNVENDISGPLAALNRIVCHWLTKQIVLSPIRTISWACVKALGCSKTYIWGKSGLCLVYKWLYLHIAFWDRKIIY